MKHQNVGTITGKSVQFTSLWLISPEKNVACYLNTVQPWPAGLSVPHKELQSIQLWELNNYDPALSQEGEAPLGKRDLGKRQSKFKSYSCLCSKAYPQTLLGVIPCLFLSYLRCSEILPSPPALHWWQAQAVDLWAWQQHKNLSLKLGRNNSCCLLVLIRCSVMSWYLQSCTIRPRSSALLDQELTFHSTSTCSIA